MERRKYRWITAGGPKRAEAEMWDRPSGANLFRRLLRKFEISRPGLRASSLRRSQCHLYARTMPAPGLRQRRRPIPPAEKLLRSGRLISSGPRAAARRALPAILTLQSL